MNENLTYGSEGERLTKISESLFLHAYPDPKSGGEPITIAYGHTDPGVIKLGDTCTKEQADAWFEEDIAKFVAIVKEFVTVPLTQGQFDACVDFCYNEGPGAPGVKDGFIWLYNGNHSSLLRMINYSQFDEAALQFERWDTAGPPGLITRHRRQRELFRTGTWN